MRYIASIAAITIILLTSEAILANDYLHCDSVVESTTDSLIVVSTYGALGDTIFIYFRSTTVDDIAAFNLLIRFDSSRIYPVTYSDSFVEIEPLGRLKTLMDTATTGSFFAQISPNSADSGALAVRFNLTLEPGPLPKMPSGSGHIFRVPFVIDSQPQNSQFTPLWSHEINESVDLGDSTFYADCRRSIMATTDSLGNFINLYPTMVSGTVRLIDPTAASVTATLTAGGYGTDTLMTGVPVEWVVSYTNNSGSNIIKAANGWSLTSAGNWSGLALDTLPLGWSSLFDLGTFINSFSITGSGADTVGLNAAAMSMPGLADNLTTEVAIISTQFDDGQDGLQACLDTSWYPPSGAWLWSTPDRNIIPVWNGPLCYTLYQAPNQPPYCNSRPNPTILTALDHCLPVSHQSSFADPEGDAIISITQLAGPGSTDASGMWSYAPSLADVGHSIPTVVIEACDQFACSYPEDRCLIEVSFTNQAPTITCPDTTRVVAGNIASISLQGTMGDCDPFIYYLCDISPSPVGTVSLDGTTGTVTFNTDSADGGISGQIFDICVGVTDGMDSSLCTLQIEVVPGQPFGIHIEKTHAAFQGKVEHVDITLSTGSEAIGGFDFLIAYDASALTITSVIPGSFVTRCGWEYFTYRYGIDVPCSGGCPSGLLRVIAIAETNNGPYHPACQTMESGETFGVLHFFVSENPVLECEYVPIRFFWTDCGDNTLSSQSGDSLFISRHVFDFDLVGEITNPTAGYPTYQGAQNEDCFPGDPGEVPVRFIDFYNGGINIICADSINPRGDMNLNEIYFEIADAVLYQNYFLFGLSVFTVDVADQIAASDVNADGTPLTLSDLVFLTRVAVGDLNPDPPGKVDTSRHSARFFQDLSSGVVSVGTPDTLGAIRLKFSGSILPNLDAYAIPTRFYYDSLNNETRVLLHSLGGPTIRNGDILSYQGDGILVEAGTAGSSGTLLINSEIILATDAPEESHSNLPKVYALHQNYPNPFNPATTISFQLAQAGTYRLEIFNIAGRKVKTFAAESSSGNIEIKWDATDMASGLYYYRLSSGDFVETRKMILLK